MLRNYLAAALRNIARNRLYAAINIVGLTVGFAAALMIALFVRDEYSYDKWIPGYDRIFRVSTTITPPGQKPVNADSTPGEVAAWLKLDFPAVEESTRLSHPGNPVLRRGEAEYHEKMYWADPSFFDVLSLPAIHGDVKMALSRQDSVVISRRIALKYFGRDDVVGQTLELEDAAGPGKSHVLEVTAVLADLPSNTHLDTDIIGSGRAPESPLARLDAHPQPPSDLIVSAHVYFRLARNASAESLAAAMPEFLRRHKSQDVAEHVSLNMMPIAAIHFHPAELFGLKPGGDPNTAYAMACVGALILAIAGLNFVNLMTARATRRATEVGVRKVSGAARPDLIVQFIGEALLYVSLSMAMAVAAVTLLMPRFNASLDRTIQFAWWRDPMLSAGLMAAVLAIGLLAGAYPALVLSSFRPSVMLSSGRARASGSGRLRQALVLSQFAMLIGLVISTVIVKSQTDYAMNQALRLDRDQVLTIKGRCDWSFRDEIRAIPGVRAAACSSPEALGLDFWTGGLQRPGGQSFFAPRIPIDMGFFDVFGLKPSAGRFFSPDYGLDVLSANADAPGPSLVINETAARMLGFESPAQAIGQSVIETMENSDSRKATPHNSEIIGVVPDFAFSASRDSISPTAYFVSPTEFRILNVKLAGSRIPETLAAIDAAWKKRYQSPIERSFLDAYVQSLYLGIIKQSQLFTLFSGVALLTACFGLLGMAAFSAEQRTKEIGIRKAMGADRTDILRMMVWEFAKPVLWANLIAWPVAYGVMRHWLQSFAYHIDLQLWMFLMASALALAIAVLTVLGHAAAVARAQPAAALRCE